MNVMITGCSKHSKEIVDCLKQNEDGVPVEVTAVNVDPNKLLRHETDYQYIVPPITAGNYIQTLLEVCRERNVKVIIPYITAELQLLADNKALFDKAGVKVSVASPEAIATLNDKNLMYEKFPGYMPKQITVHSPTEAAYALDELRYPDTKVCCKIAGKCGGAGFCILDEEKCYDITLFNRCGANRYIGRHELFAILDKGVSEVILQEYVPGIDYSVCVLADKGKVVQAVGYAGYDMEFGAVVNGQILTDSRAISIAESVASETGLDGNACFDFILSKNDGESYLLECNPRINATLGFCRAAGVNLVWLRCKQLIGGSIGERLVPKEGLRVQKYYESEYFV